MNLNKRTLVLGASPNSARYSFLAASRLRAQGHNVVAVGLREGYAGPVPIEKPADPPEGIDTITLYLNPQRQKEYYQYILDTHPQADHLQPGH